MLLQVENICLLSLSGFLRKLVLLTWKTRNNYSTPQELEVLLTELEQQVKYLF